MRKFVSIIAFAFLCVSYVSATAHSYAAPIKSAAIDTSRLSEATNAPYSPSMESPGLAGVALPRLTAASYLRITSSSTLATGRVGSAYTAKLHATGGKSPYQWFLTSGALPAGLSLANTGAITGTPTAAGNSTFAVEAIDHGSPAQTATLSFSLAIASRLAITSPSKLTFGVVGTGYTAQLQATGGTPAYTWSLTSGALPAGLSLGSTGAITGTPTAAGNSTFAVKATDQGSPAQTATLSVSLAIASPLAITSPSTLTSGQVGTGYTAQLQATGGTPAYMWSMASGALPAGLSLGSTGAITGTPTAAGNATFAVKATDHGSPAQTATLSVSLAIASSLAITSPSTLSSGQVGTGYTAQLQATGGTPAYTWSMASGALPAGLSLGRTGAITGAPTAAGNSTFGVQATDNSSPAHTAIATLSISVAAASTGTGSGTTWYVRPDGGTRYSSNVTGGQCNGMYDTSYASTGGTGINQNCAFNDVRFLWQDGSYTTGSDNGPAVFPGWGWVIAGGDTVIIRGSIGTGVSYRVGYPNASGPWDGQEDFGVAGDPYGSGAPPPPSGSPTQHTRILGENYLSCQSASAKTQLHGGFGTSVVLAMNGASYVDVACLDITDFSNCARSGLVNQCNSNVGSLDDYAGNGISWNNTSTNDTLTNIHIHGMASAGMIGATGTGMLFSYLDVIGNPSSGWNADDGSGTSGTGTLLVQNFNVGWNGCAEEYPIVDPVPYTNCSDDNSGGYGDGFGTATVLTTGWQIHWDQGNVFYNTQDGLDQLHVVGPGSSTTVTRVLAYGNMGQQLKIGGQVGVIQNSVIIGNCNALRQAIPGTPAGYNSGLSDFCRAADTGIVLSINDGSTSKFENNTFYSDNATGLEINTAVTCATATCLIDYDNNIFLGFLNNTADGYPNGGSGGYANPIYMNDAGGALAFANAGSSNSNNITYHAKDGWTCPATWLYEQNSLCTDPQLIDETWHLYGYGNVAPSPNSIAIGAGLYLPDLTIDYTGQNRANPPSIGAYEQ